MMIRRSGALVALLAALLLTSCAGDTAGSSTMPVDSPVPGASAESAVPDATATSVAPLPAEPTTKAPGGTETITGTIAAGVEPGCIVLTSPSGGSHLLILKDPATRAAAKVGSSVTVVGRAQPGMMSTCQQGTPFLVTEVRAS